MISGAKSVGTFQRYLIAYGSAGVFAPSIRRRGAAASSALDHGIEILARRPSQMAPVGRLWT
jgi:hypothetical protein